MSDVAKHSLWSRVSVVIKHSLLSPSISPAQCIRLSSAQGLNRLALFCQKCHVFLKMRSRWLQYLNKRGRFRARLSPYCFVLGMCKIQITRIRNSSQVYIEAVPTVFLSRIFHIVFLPLEFYPLVIPGRPLFRNSENGGCIYFFLFPHLSVFSDHVKMLIW